MISVNQSRFGASAANTRFTKSSKTGGPYFLFFQGRSRCAAEVIPAAEHSLHAVRRLIRAEGLDNMIVASVPFY